MLNKKLLSAAVQASVAPTGDPNFNQTVLLLHGDGTNGAQNNTFVGANYQPDQYAVSFDGSGDTLSLPASQTPLLLGNSDFTFECWVYRVATGNQCIFQGQADLATAAGSSYVFFLGSTGSDVYIGSSGIGVTSPNPAAGQWNHVAWVRTGNTFSSYLNGSRVGTVATLGTSSVNNGSTTYPPTIGGFATGTNQLNGYISNARLIKGSGGYDATQSTITVPTAPLTAVSGTSLLTCQSATIVDNSSNAFTITANGNAAAIATTTLYPAITRNGNTTQGTFTPFSQPAGYWSNYFDGSGDSLQIADNAALELGNSNFTIECWAYFQSATEAVICSKWFNTRYSYLLQCTESGGLIDGLLFAYTSNGNTITVRNYVASISLNTWHHIALTRESGNTKAFLNGTQIGSTTSDNVTFFNGTEPFRIGRNGDTASATINGYISNFRLVNGTAVYTSNFTPPTTPLTAITNTSLLTCQDNRFRDGSSNNFAITRNGDVRVTAFSPFAPTAAYDAGTNGGSGYFDGTGDKLTLSSMDGRATGDFTIEGWFYLISGNFQFTIGSETTSRIIFVAIPGQDVLHNIFGSSNVSYGGTFPSNSWAHLAIVRSGTTVTVYINGVSTGTTSTLSGTIGNANGVVVWGTNTDSGGQGYLSNFRYLRGTALYTSNFTPPTAPLTAITNTSLLLNFTNGGIIDSTGKNVLETVGNAQIDTTVKKYGTGSMEFDGNGDALISPRSPDYDTGAGDFTVECWVYPTSAQKGGIVRQSNSGSFGGYALSWEFQKFGMLSSYNGTTWAINTLSSSTFALNTWHHVAIVRNGSSLTLYVNGVSEATASIGTNTVLGGFPIYIGWSGFSTEYFLGYIDDLRITKGVARYTSAFTPPTAPFEDL